MKYIDETGNRYGRLTVLRKYPGLGGTGAKWLCRCDCGMEIAVTGTKLRTGNTKSCGCFREMTFEERRKIGLWPVKA